MAGFVLPLDIAASICATRCIGRRWPSPCATARHRIGSGLFDGLPTQTLAGLGNDDALTLLTSQFRGSLDERIRDQIIAEARGNPLRSSNCHGTWDPRSWPAGSACRTRCRCPSASRPVTGSRLAELPDETQRLLLVAAAEPLGEPVLLWRAADRLGIGTEAAAPAEAARLLDLGLRVRFRHPLVRSAIYRAASPEHRRAAHRALAEATDPLVDPDRRAWHRAQSVFVPDETVAHELERSADRACARGGIAAAAGFLERATALTPDPALRAARALAAARFKHRAGAAEAAIGLLATAQAGPLDARQRALAELLSAQIAAHTGRGGSAPSLVLDAARGRPGVAGGPPRPAAGRGDRTDLGGLRGGRPVDADSDQRVPGRHAEHDRDSHRLWLACNATADLWDEEGWVTLSERQVSLARQHGALIALPNALRCLALARIHTGEFAEAATLIKESYTVLQTPGIGPTWCSVRGAASWNASCR